MTLPVNSDVEGLPLRDRAMTDHQMNSQQRLDEIVTQWSLLRLAHNEASMDSAEARRRMLLKYNRAIRDYAGALLQHESDADEVSQDILVRMLRGDFANADPEKGKFRHFLKTAVRNMVRTYWTRKQRRESVQSDLGSGGVAEDMSPSARFDLLASGNAAKAGRARLESLDDAWRTTILNLTLRALEDFQTQHAGCQYHTILKLRWDHPDADFETLAEKMQALSGRPWTPTAMRQQVRRARIRFAQLLVEEVAASLKAAAPEAIEEELGDLGLLDYVQPFLSADWRTGGSVSLKDA